VAGAAIDGRALAVALGLSLLTAVVFGLAPVLQALGPRLADALKVGDRSGTVGRLGTRARRGLVVSELALAVLLLAGSGLLLRSFLRLRAVPPGFATQGVLSLEIALSPARYGEPARRQAALDRMAGELRRLPGVEATAMVSRLPLTGPALGGPFSIEGRPFDPTAGTPPFAVYRAASPDYHAALGVSIARGRELSSADRPESSRVVVINRALERAFFPREDPLGHRVKLGAPGSPRPWLTIVGVAADVRDHALSLPSPPELTVPLAQDPPASAVVLVRTAGDPLALAAPARKAILAADPEQPVTRVRTLRQIVDESIAERRTPAVVLAAFALVAMTLAALGTYGVMSYTVSRRTREIGLRMALGARPADVGRLVVGEGLGLAAAGLALGFAGALAFGRTLASLLFEVPPADPVTFAGVALLLALVTAAASARPARRAAMVEPAVALRRE
jgi:putative ABC transport system permease protein